MVLYTFDALAMPPTVNVPPGALDSWSTETERRSLLMRSRCTKPLREQAAELHVDAEIYYDELKLEAGRRPILEVNLAEGLFSRDKYLKHSDAHPANVIALAAACRLVSIQRGALLADVADTFVVQKQRVLHALRNLYGSDKVYVPKFFDAFDFQDPAQFAAARTATMFNGVGTYRRVYDWICDRLNVIRLPVKTASGHWRLALLPNLVGASDTDMIDQVGIFYELHASRARLGASLSCEDIRNLKDIIPAGNGTRTLIDYLIVKFADAPTCNALGYTPGRSKSLVARYDRFARELHGARAKARLKVAGKVIKTTGAAVKDSEKASSYEMRRAVLKEKLVTEVARRARRTLDTWVGDAEFIEIIRAVVRGMGETSSKGARGTTPEDLDVFVAQAFHCPGGRVDRICTSVMAAVKARFNVNVSRSTIYGAFKVANIQFASNIGLMEPVLQQHYCRARVMMYTWLFLPWAANVMILSIDQKALYKANCDRAKGKDMQIMSERARWGVTNKGSGYDTLCSLALFSIWLLPTKALQIETVARPGFAEWLKVIARDFSWIEDEYGERESCAAAFGYVAAGKELKAEKGDCEPETSARNQGSVDKFCTFFSEYTFGPPSEEEAARPPPDAALDDRAAQRRADLQAAKARVAAEHAERTGAAVSPCVMPRKMVPVVLFVLDNSKGPADKDYAFALGIFWYIHDIDVAAAVSPAGKCSYEVPVEKVNGHLARRMRGSMIQYEAETADPKARAEESLRTLCDRADGATFNGGGGCVDVFVAADVETDFPWDARDQKKFMGLSAEGKVTFISDHEKEWAGISDVYRLIYSYQMGHNKDSHLLFSHDSGSCMWRKRVGCEAHLPWRGPLSLLKMLDSFDKGLPPSIIPSSPQEPDYRKGSYARLAELYRRRAEEVAPDEYNPRKLMDRMWKTNGLKLLYTKNDGKLPAAIWLKLEEMMLCDRKTIEHDLAHLASLARGDVAMEALEKAQKARGIDGVVDAFVRRAMPERRDTKNQVTQNVNAPHIVAVLVGLASALTGVSVPDKKQLDAMRKASLVQLLFEKAKLSAQQPTLQQQLQQQLATVLAAAAAPVAAAPFAVPTATPVVALVGALAAALPAATPAVAPAIMPDAPAVPAAVTATATADALGNAIPCTVGPAAATGSSSSDAIDSPPSDHDVSELAQELIEADEEAVAYRVAADAALQELTDAQLGDDVAVAMAAGEHTCETERVDVTEAARTATDLTARRKAKVWTCGACGKGYKERSAVRQRGGSYVCIEDCGLMEGRRPHAKKRPLGAES